MPARRAVLLLLLLAPLATPAARSATVVTFDNPVPPGTPGNLVNGIFEGINFGTGQWRWYGPHGPDPTNNVTFDSALGTSRTFSFSPPRILDAVTARTVITTGTLTLTDDSGQTRTQLLPTGSQQVVPTGWRLPSATVTVAFTAGRSLGLDDITHREVTPGGDTTPPTVAIPRAYHQTAILMPDARVLVSGSGGLPGMTDPMSGEIFSPPASSAGRVRCSPRPRPSSLMARASSPRPRTRRG